MILLKAADFGSESWTLTKMVLSEICILRMFFVKLVWFMEFTRHDRLHFRRARPLPQAFHPARRFFACYVRSLLLTHEQQREIMQEVAVVLWRKFDAQTQEYQISGSGKNMWFDKDEFHFVWKRMKGDFIVRTQAKLIGKGVDKHRKLGWMVRTTLDTDSPHVNATVHGDGVTSLQSRETVGAITKGIKSEATYPDVIQLER